jgi:hypothetical protein
LASEYFDQAALHFATPSSSSFSNSENAYPWSRRESVLLETEVQVPLRVNGRLPERQPAPGTPIHIAQRQLPRARDTRQPQNAVLQEQLVLCFGTCGILLAEHLPMSHVDEEWLDGGKGVEGNESTWSSAQRVARCATREAMVGEPVHCSRRSTHRDGPLMYEACPTACMPLLFHEMCVSG